jgi:hypothetical protein
MILDLIYDYPIALSGAAVVIVAVLLSWLGLTIAARLWPHEIRSNHNDVAGFILAIVGVVYAVLLAFIAVAVWQNYDSVNTAVDREASLVSDIYRDAIAMPDPARTELRDNLDKYLTAVVETEWPVQRTGRIKKRGWQALNHFHALLAKTEPIGPNGAVVHAEMLRALNNLYDARRIRLLSARGGLNGFIWTILLLGGAITVAFSYFFGVRSLRVHFAMTGMLTASLALVFVLMIALDKPFRGSLAIEPTPFIDVQKELRHLPAGD